MLKNTILIVDDGIMERDMLRNILSEDFNVLEAENGEAALSLISMSYKKISAILVDLMMPVMDGFEVIKRVKENKVLSQIPIIVATASSNEKEQEKALALGANGFITKPYNPMLLQYSIKNIVDLREMSAIASESKLDKLTGLFNREAFFEEAKKMIRRHEAGYYLMCCINIENFRVINDQFGFRMGDEVLRHVSRCLKDCVNEIGGVCCRSMADEFILICPSKYKDSQFIEDLYHNSKNVPSFNRTIQVRIGYYIIDDFTISINSMHDRATHALESMKNQFGKHIIEFDDEMRKCLQVEQEIVSEMHNALETGQFETWYQPVFNCQSNEIVSVEVLTRWNHPKRGLLAPPGDFVPIFEKNGFIYDMDKYIWEQACQNLYKWIEMEYPLVPFCVKVSRFDMTAPDFLQTIVQIVDKYIIPHELICLEISGFAKYEEETKLFEVLNELAFRGFTLIIDDFGEGNSSLNILRNAPVRFLKINTSITGEPVEVAKGGIIACSLMDMARMLGVGVIAENVESREKKDYLEQIGCLYMQGYYFAKPMPTAEYEQFLINQKNHRDENFSLSNDGVFWNSRTLEAIVNNFYSGSTFAFEKFRNGYNLICANKGFTDIFNVLPDETVLLKDLLSKVLSESEYLQVLEAMERALDSEKYETCIISTLPSQNGAAKKRVMVLLRKIAQNNNRKLMYGYFKDITHLKNAEEKLGHMVDLEK